MTPHQASLLVYDGECRFCTSSARRLARRLPAPTAVVSGRQLGPEGLAAIGLTPGQAREAAWWVAPDGRLSRGHLAIGCALVAGGGWSA
ncbi:MAG: thiol-disulfide oxidoreductase DCC family protein, partial [Acidimicrobiales bacterium]